MNSTPHENPSHAGHFVTTHWSAVVRAGNNPSTEGQGALSELCQAYWYPLYAFIRRQGHSPHDAEDLTQEFFAKLLTKNYIADARQEKGKFRSFLLVALKRFMANEWDRQHAKKRGAFQTFISIDQDLAETRFTAEGSKAEQPDLLYEKQWAITLLEQVMARLHREFTETGREKLFQQLRSCLTKEESALPYAEIARQSGQTEAAIKVAVHRMRARFRNILRQEIAKTVSTTEEVEDELRHLFASLG